MNSETPSRFRRFLPYGCAAVALLLTYVCITAVSDRLLFAAAVSAVVALSTFFGTRIVLSRGRVSLAMTTIGLPLLIAALCYCGMQLNPFTDRQRSITSLRQAGIRLNARTPTIAGEWVRDYFGNMLPTWVVSAIGPDSMSVLTYIEGDLESLQSVPLHRIETEGLRRVQLTRSRGEISERLIEWLNDLPQDCGIWLTLEHCTRDDALVLTKLINEWGAQLHLDDRHVDLSGLGQPAALQILTAELTAAQARQLSSTFEGRAQPAWVTIESRVLAPEVIRGFGSLNQNCELGFKGATVDDATFTEMCRLDRFRISLTSVDLQLKSNPVPSDKTASNTKYLGLGEMAPTLDQCVMMVNRCGCKCLTITFNNPKIFSDEEVSQLWEACPQLQELRMFGNDWVNLERPVDE